MTMRILIFSACLILLLSVAPAFAKIESDRVSSEIKYVGEQSEQQGNSIYGSPNTSNRFGGLPGSYGGSAGSREILRNRFRGTGSKANDENSRSSSDQGTSGSTYPIYGIDGPDEILNGVFANPYLGQRRRTYGMSPGYGTGIPPGYGRPDLNGSGVFNGYGTPSLDGSYWPQPGIYSSSPGYRPGMDQGYIYPMRGISDGGVSLRQPGGAYGFGRGYGLSPGGGAYGLGRGYGLSPGVYRNNPSGYIPSEGVDGIYRRNPGGYGPALFGYDRYPELAYPGLGYEYGRISASDSHGDKLPGSVDQEGSRPSYLLTTPSATLPSGGSKQKTSPKKEEP